VTIASITSTALDRAYGIGSAIEITLNFSEATTLAGGSLTLRLNTGAEVTIAPFTQQMSATATYTVGSGQASSDLDGSGIFLNGATLRNNNNNNVSLDVLTGFALGNTRSIVVDGIAPTIGDIDTIFKNPITVATGSTLAIALRLVAVCGCNAVCSLFAICQTDADGSEYGSASGRGWEWCWE
jgi:hypothetical protein